MRAILIAGLIGLGPCLAAPARAADVSIPLIVPDTSSPYWQTVLAGGRKAGEDVGASVATLGMQDAADANGQISVLAAAVAGKPPAIVIAPSRYAALGKPITEAARTVKIVGIASGADTQSFISLVSTDNVKAGRAAADTLAAGIQARTGRTEGNVALITARAGVGALDERAQGVREELKRYPGLVLRKDKVADGFASPGLTIASDLLDGNLAGIIASDLETTEGAGQAIADNDAAARVTLVGFDTDDKVGRLLDVGAIYALIVEDPFRMGYEGVKLACGVGKGEGIPSHVETGFTVAYRGVAHAPPPSPPAAP